jgi:hypothetical protein
MALKKAQNALGLTNQSFPLWELGAVLYWRAANATVVQTPGGVGVSTFTISDSGGAQGSPYVGWDPGKGHYKRILNSATEMPKSGFFSSSRTNYFDDSEAADRGFDFQAGLTTDLTQAIPAGHVMDPVSNPYTTLCNISNTSGSAKYAYQLPSGGTTTANKGFGVLVKRSDGGAVTGADLSLLISVADPTLGGAIQLAGATSYRKIRSDGWYEVVAKTTSGTSILYFSLQIENGANLYIELPVVESVAAGVDVASFSGTTTGTGNRSRRCPQIKIRREDASGVGLEGFAECGWMACSLVAPYDAATFSIPTGLYISQDDTDADCVKMETYSTSESPAGAMYKANASQFFMSTSAVFTFGQSNGAVLTWGYSNGSKQAHLFINGRYVSIDTSWSIPTVANPTFIKIGFTVTGSKTSNITGVAIDGVSNGTAYGTTGALRYVSASHTIYYTAPGDTEGAGVVLTTDGTVTLYSNNVNYFIQAKITYASLPGSNKSDTVTITAGSAAFVWLQEVAIGKSFLSRAECRLLSKWFQGRTNHSFG